MMPKTAMRDAAKSLIPLKASIFCFTYKEIMRGFVFKSSGTTIAKE
jgi:hypothetical protein